MNAINLLLPANENGYESGFAYIDAISARGDFFTEYKDCVPAETIKCFLRSLASDHIESKDPYFAQTIIFLGRLPIKAQPKEIVRELMLDFMVSLGRIPAWFAMAKQAGSGSTKIHLFILTRDTTGKELLLSDPDLHLLTTFAKALSTRDAK
ncbi:MAG: hypothetical protein K2X81_00230 [Candidatus Obscuribacterales bacterium]|jgi:hypothetical protein|nr:hypothetical protein [Candidatus Obscuribacterales bacterium]